MGSIFFGNCRLEEAFLISLIWMMPTTPTEPVSILASDFTLAQGTCLMLLTILTILKTLRVRARDVGAGRGVVSQNTHNTQNSLLGVLNDADC